MGNAYAALGIGGMSTLDWELFGLRGQRVLGTCSITVYSLLPINSSLILFILSTYRSDYVIQHIQFWWKANTSWHMIQFLSFLSVIDVSIFLCCCDNDPKTICATTCHNVLQIMGSTLNVESVNSFNTSAHYYCPKKSVYFHLHKRGSTRHIVCRIAQPLLVAFGPERK